MTVLKLLEVSLYIFISGLISTIIPPVLSLFLLYTPLHSYLTLSVRQFALLFYLYFFRQCCYKLSSGTVFLRFPILLPLLYSLMIPKLYSYTSVLYMTTCSSCILLPSMLK